MSVCSTDTVLCHVHSIDFMLMLCVEDLYAGNQICSMYAWDATVVK